MTNDPIQLSPILKVAWLLCDNYWFVLCKTKQKHYREHCGALATESSS